MDHTETIVAQLIEHSCERLSHYQSQIERCAALLDDEQLWYRPNGHVNSVANLMLHLAGNVRQWILGGVAGEAIARDRPAEFAARDGRPAEEIVPTLREAVENAISVFRSLEAAELTQLRSIQGYDVTVQRAVLHVVEHFAFHAGQIVHATKWIKDVDLSLYDTQGQRIDRSGNP